MALRGLEDVKSCTEKADEQFTKCMGDASKAYFEEAVRVETRYRICLERATQDQEKCSCRAGEDGISDDHCSRKWFADFVECGAKRDREFNVALVERDYGEQGCRIKHAEEIGRCNAKGTDIAPMAMLADLPTRLIVGNFRDWYSPVSLSPYR